MSAEQLELDPPAPASLAVWVELECAKSRKRINQSVAQKARRAQEALARDVARRQLYFARWEIHYAQRQRNRFIRAALDSITIEPRPMPVNSGKTIRFRRLNRYPVTQEQIWQALTK